MKRIIIGGVQSGSGKTTIATGVMAALAQRERVQAFKAGPDYIDPSYHSRATGRPSRNLDTWMVEPPRVLELFLRAAGQADIAVVEGVMGLFDGRTGGGDAGSTAALAKLLRAPVVLVVDAAKIARSAAAVVLGFRLFDPEINVAGVVLNRIASPRHYEAVANPIEQEAGVPVVGYLPRDPDLVLPERYLGLVPTVEGTVADAYFDRLRAACERTIDLERIERIAASAPPLSLPQPHGARGEEEQVGNPPSLWEGARGRAVASDTSSRQGAPDFPPLAPPRGRGMSGSGPQPTTRQTSQAEGWNARDAAVGSQEIEALAEAALFPQEPAAVGTRIAVARDRAFSFYYEDNLDLLRAWGAEIVAFSPLADACLPEAVSGVYLGGGFPELFAAELAANRPMQAALRAAAENGVPIYAECGGLMYLGRSLRDQEGRAHTMAGLIPARSAMPGSFMKGGRLALGYRELTALRDTAIAAAGTALRAHEFHWSLLDDPPLPGTAAYAIGDDPKRVEGFVHGSVLASYMHLHFGSDPAIAPRFVDACARVQRPAVERARSGE